MDAVAEGRLLNAKDDKAVEKPLGADKGSISVRGLCKGGGWYPGGAPVAKSWD